MLDRTLFRRTILKLRLGGPLHGLPRELARNWIADDRVLPLLDGLDEVPLQHRLACARAIDDFHRADGLLPLAVTSRSTDYDALGLTLSLGSALMIRPPPPSPDRGVPLSSRRAVDLRQPRLPRVASPAEGREPFGQHPFLGLGLGCPAAVHEV